MKLFNLNFSKSNVPSLKKLRPAIFDVNHYWFLSLGIFFLIFTITGLVGFKIFYSGYFTGYDTNVPTEDFQNLINTKNLKKAIEDRSKFVTEENVLPRDPSI